MKRNEQSINSTIIKQYFKTHSNYEHKQEQQQKLIRLSFCRKIVYWLVVSIFFSLSIIWLGTFTNKAVKLSTGFSYQVNKSGLSNI